MIDHERILLWVNSMAVLTRAPKQDVPTPETIALYAKMLGNGDIPGEAFAETSLSAVAAGFKFFPPYAEMRSALMTWWKQNRPIPEYQAIPGPTGVTLTQEDQRWLDFYWKRHGEILAEGYRPKNGVAGDLANLASLVRERSVEAWKLIGGDPGLVELDQDHRDAIVANFRRQMPANEQSRPLPPEPVVSDFDAHLQALDAMTPEEKAAWRRARGLKVA